MADVAVEDRQEILPRKQEIMANAIRMSITAIEIH